MKDRSDDLSHHERTLLPVPVSIMVNDLATQLSSPADYQGGGGGVLKVYNTDLSYNPPHNNYFRSLDVKVFWV